MKNQIKTDIKRYIILNLEDRIDQILCNKNKVRLLSKRDLISIVKFMKKNKIYSKSFLEYAYTKSIHIYSSIPSLPDLDNDILTDSARKGNLDVIKLLLSNKIRELFPSALALLDLCADNNYNIGLASRYGHLDVVKFLLSPKIRKLFPNIDPSDDDNWAIRLASQYGHLDVVKFLLSSEVVRLFPKIDPCAINNSPIILASQCGHLDIVKFLLSDEILTLYPEIDPSAQNNFAIRFASKSCHKDVVEFLRKHVYNSAPLSDILQNKI